MLKEGSNSTFHTINKLFWGGAVGVASSLILPCCACSNVFFPWFQLNHSHRHLVVNPYLLQDLTSENLLHLVSPQITVSYPKWTTRRDGFNLFWHFRVWKLHKFKFCPKCVQLIVYCYILLSRPFARRQSWKSQAAYRTEERTETEGGARGNFSTHVIASQKCDDFNSPSTC